jgi:hypothetical protein
MIPQSFGWSRNALILMKLESSLLCSNKPFSGRCTEPVKSSSWKGKTNIICLAFMSYFQFSMLGLPEISMRPATSQGVTRIYVICVAPSDSSLIKIISLTWFKGNYLFITSFIFLVRISLFRWGIWSWSFVALLEASNW